MLYVFSFSIFYLRPRKKRKKKISPCFNATYKLAPADPLLADLFISIIYTYLQKYLSSNQSLPGDRLFIQNSARPSILRQRSQRCSNRKEEGGKINLMLDVLTG